MCFELNVGVIGYHISSTLVNALISIPRLYPDLGCRIHLKSLCGRNRELTGQMASAFGFQKTTTSWQELIEDPEIDLLINGGPNYLHAEPCVQALEAGKHVFCEKPLARSASEALTMAEAAARANRVSMVGYNYRFIPAVVLARRLILEGKIGRIYHGRLRYVDEAFTDPETSFSWRMDKELSGRGIVGDLGSHVSDLARFLLGQSLGEPTGISGFTRIFDPSRGGRKVTAPDAAFGTLHFANGMLMSLEVSSLSSGRKNSLTFEISGEKGALFWDLERLNELQVYLHEDKSDGVSGFHSVYVSPLDHPELVPWPPGEHPVGIDISYLLELRHFVKAVIAQSNVSPDGAGFDDGLAVEIICENLEESSRNNGGFIEFRLDLVS
jgi:predicted dehydrogenase